VAYIRTAAFAGAVPEHEFVAALDGVSTRRGRRGGSGDPLRGGRRRRRRHHGGCGGGVGGSRFPAHRDVYLSCVCN